MIRRETPGEYQLIAQHDHAQLAGELARHWGNGRFAPLLPHGPVVDAIGLHDSGWPEQDEMPALNGDDRPRHIFETPLPVALAAWQASSERAQAANDYTGLLVSLHGLNLSIIPASRPHTHEEVFLLNKFQHREVERQELLRRRLGLRVDLPLCYGLPMPKAITGDAEHYLLYNFRVLQSLDRISLALCCSEHLFDTVDELLTRPGSEPATLTLRRDGMRLHIAPWPLSVSSLRVHVAYKAIPRRTYRDEVDLQQAFTAGEQRSLQFELVE